MVTCGSDGDGEGGWVGGHTQSKKAGCDSPPEEMSQISSGSLNRYSMTKYVITDGEGSPRLFTV